MKNLWYLTPMCDPNVKITSGTKVITYQYDELNQLIRENNGVLGITVLYPVLRRKPRPT